MDGTLVWTFLPNDGDPQGRGMGPYGMGIVTAGTYFTGKDPTVMRDAKLHGWIALLDALLHAHGFLVCRARLDGAIAEDRERMLHATEFTALWVLDLRRLLHEFACDLGERMLIRERDAGRERDTRFLEALTAKRLCLAGELTERDLREWWRATMPVAIQDDRTRFGQSVPRAVRGAMMPFVDQSRIARQTIKAVVREVLADGAAIGFDELNAELTRRVLDAYHDGGQRSA